MNFLKFNKLINILIFTFCLTNVVPCFAAPISFQDWRINQAAEQIKELQNDNKNLSKDEIEKSLTRAKEAMKKENWSEAASEYARVIGHQPEDRHIWRQYSIALQNKNFLNNDWKTSEQAKLAAINLYLISKTPEAQAEALLIYGNNISPLDEYETPHYSEIYTTLQSLTDLEKLRSKFNDLSNMMNFKFLNVRVNNQATPPNACMTFSHPLKTHNINFSDYLEITPKIDGVLKANNNELCLSPVQFGINYDLKIKAGFVDAYGEKTANDQKFSFRVNDQPSLLSFKTKAYVLRKEEKASIPLSGVNVDSVNIKILRINDRSLNQLIGSDHDFLKVLWDYSIDNIKNKNGELLFSGEMDFSNTKNQTTTRLIPFTELVKKTEPGIYLVQATEEGAVFNEKAKATQWVIVSDQGITTFKQTDGGIWVNVRSLQTASPLANVELRLLAYNNSILKTVKTNNEGMAFFSANITAGKGGNRPLLILAYGPKDDFSFISLDQPAFDLSDRGVGGRKIPGNLDAFLYTEQGVYRPGDTVHMNALLRDLNGNAKAEIPLTFKVLRSDEALVSEQMITGNELGFYQLSIPLQNTSRTGNWTIQAFLDPKKEPIGRVQFSVEDFVPSRVVVELSSNETIIKPKQSFPLQVKAKYLFGSPASGFAGLGSFLIRPRVNPFPKWSEYRFGLINDSFSDLRQPFELPILDKEGKAETSVNIDKALDTTLPLEAVINVALSDQGGRPETGALKVPIDNTSLMIGIKTESNNNIFSETDEAAVFDVITIDDQQNLIPTQNLEYELYEEHPSYTWYQINQYSPWQYQTRLQDKFVTKGTLSTEIDKASKLSLPIKEWGQYRLEIKDPKTQVASSIRFNKGFEANDNTLETPDKITIKLNQDKIPPNGSVELQIESPFEGQALITLANSKVLETRNIQISPKGTRIKLIANDDWGVGIYCLVSAFRPLNDKSDLIPDDNLSANINKPFLPKRAIGLAWIGIDPKDRILDVSFEMPSEVKPNQTINVPFTVTQGNNETEGKSKNNKPLTGKTQVSIAAVDEGILKLTDYITPKPQEYFFGKQRLSIELRDIYGKLIDPMPGLQGDIRSGGDASILSRNMQALSKRSFKIVSLYHGLVDLDKNGKGNVDLQLPNFNGNLRIMAVAFNDKNVGSKESNLIVRDPFVIEGVMPRFLAPHDSSQLFLSLHNLNAPEGHYDLEIKTKGEISSTSENKLSLDLKEKDTKEISIPILASQSIGDGSIEINLIGQGIELNQIFEISVRPSEPYQMISDSHLLNAGESANLKIPAIKDFIPESTLAMVTWSSSVPWDTLAISKRLSEYAYGCLEQTTSKGFGALYGNLKSNKTMVEQIAGGLSEKQSSEGSFTLWGNGTNNGDIFLTSYAADFLLQAKENNIPIPKYTLERAIDWLSKYISPRETNTYRLTETAYALYILTKADNVETGALRYFFDTYFNELKSPIARAFIGTSLAKRGELERAKEAFNNILQLQIPLKETPYGTSLRDRFIILKLMRETLNVAPSLTQLSQQINTLLQVLQREVKEITIGRFSTQELAWGILASHAMESFTNSEQPVTLKINDKVEQTGNSDNMNFSIKAQDLIKGIRIKNESDKTLWQNLMVSGLPISPLKAQSNGIEIERKYYTLEGDKISPDNLKQGKQIVVVLEGNVTDENSHQLMLIDLLPAGFEIENPRLGQSGLPETFKWLESPTVADYIERRDDRLMASLHLDGKNNNFRIAYIIRAITPGAYQYPGLYAEDMYAPILNARTNAEKIKILAD